MEIPGYMPLIEIVNAGLPRETADGRWVTDIRVRTALPEDEARAIITEHFAEIARRVRGLRDLGEDEIKHALETVESGQLLTGGSPHHGESDFDAAYRSAMITLDRARGHALDAIAALMLGVRHCPRCDAPVDEYRAEQGFASCPACAHEFEW